MSREYLTFLTSQYQNSTKFLEWMDSLISKMMDILNTTDLMNAAFDVDYAVGDQLDTLGVIIGISRGLRVPIPNVFFCWYDGTTATEYLGWEMGSWRDPKEGEGVAEMSILPDDAYRQILKFKIIQNLWKGTINELYEAWEKVFASDGLTLDIIDNQDMTAEFIITGSVIPVTVQYILLGNYLPLKPSGVYVDYTFNEGSP
jgi:hypothetical protein